MSNELIVSCGVLAELVELGVVLVLVELPVELELFDDPLDLLLEHAVMLNAAVASTATATARLLVMMGNCSSW